MLNHYPLEGDPACGILKEPTMVPAINSQSTSCIDCCFKMIAETDSVKQMEGWMKQYQTLRRTLVYEKQLQAEREHLERIRLAPLHVPQSHLETEQQMHPWQFIASIPLDPEVVTDAELPPAFLSAWLQYFQDMDTWKAQCKAWLSADRFANDLWYETIGEPCNQRIISYDEDDNIVIGSICAQPAIESTTDQFGLPFTRCEASHIPDDLIEPEQYDRFDYTKKSHSTSEVY